MRDLVTFGETMLRLSPPPNTRVLDADEFGVQAAGAESNVAVAAARLGIDATWLSKVPDSMLGERVLTELRSHGVRPAVVRSSSGRQGTYYVEHAGAPRGTNVVYDRSNAAVTTATPDELDTTVVDDCSLFFTTGITPALSETLEATTKTLLERADQTAFDLNYRSKLWSTETAKATYESLLPSVDILFAPERDTKSVLGIEGDAESIANTLRSQYDCSTVVLTRGDEGALAVTAEGTITQPAFETETADPIGTGDAFVGGFLARHLVDAPVSECLEWAAATAALKRTIEGDVALVSPSEVQSVLGATTNEIDR